MWRPARSGWWTGIGNLVAVLVLYFVVPVNTDMHPGRLALTVVLSLVAVGVAGYLVARASIRAPGQLRLRPLRPVHLVLVLEFVMVVFALLYYILARNTDGQLSGIETRLDSLYFTAVTTGTVGFGDIRAVGQVARGLVTAQIVFNLGFIAAFAGLFKGVIRQPRSVRQDGLEHDDSTSDEVGQETREHREPPRPPLDPGDPPAGHRREG